MIRPEQKRHLIKAYTTKTHKAFVKQEARKRGIAVSELIKVALYDYFNPREVPKSAAIVRIDRTPKGSTEPIRKNHFRECIEELKTVLEKRREENE